MDEEMRSEQNITFDNQNFFLKRWVLRLDLKAFNVDTVQRERGRKYQTVGSEQEKTIYQLLPADIERRTMHTEVTLGKVSVAQTNGLAVKTTVAQYGNLVINVSSDSEADRGVAWDNRLFDRQNEQHCSEPFEVCPLGHQGD